MSLTQHLTDTLATVLRLAHTVDRCVEHISVQQRTITHQQGTIELLLQRVSRLEAAHEHATPPPAPLKPPSVVSPRRRPAHGR